jgi:hypothetical protein
MEIFNKHIFGSDADYFKQLSVIEQVNWIKKHTNQQNDNLINEFLSNIPENNDKNCIDCGNKRKGISEKITTDTESVGNGIVGTEDNIKRPKKPKRRKN